MAAKRHEFSGHYRIEKASSIKNKLKWLSAEGDKRAAFLRTMLANSSYEEYERKVGRKVVVVSPGFKVSGHDELMYARERRWISGGTLKPIPSVSRQRASQNNTLVRENESAPKGPQSGSSASTRSNKREYRAFNNLNDPRAVEKSLKEFDAIGRTRFLAKYKFGKAKEYMLRDTANGKLYDSKAVVGAAYGYQFPRQGPLKTNDFSGGEQQSQKKLESLGFKVVKVGSDWSGREIYLVVADYFKMLELQASGQEFNKSERNNKLRRRLKNRSKGSVESKHQNISAVLRQEGLPIVVGYKARGNFQEKLKLAVLDYLESSSVRARIRRSQSQAYDVPGSSKNPSWRSAYVQPPQLAAPSKRKVKKRPRIPKQIDFAERDFKNRFLGREGEEWVCRLERRRLRDEGRSDLARKVEPISITMGDGAGYDVRSFNRDGSVRFIEVKTTKGGPKTPFILSRNEIEFSAEGGKAFMLYRVFDFGKKARFYTLQGSLRHSVWLAPQEYRATPRKRLA